MSADFWSLCASMPPLEAARYFAQLEGGQVRAPLIDADEATVFDFDRDDGPLDLRAVSDQYAGALPNLEFTEGAYVRLSFELSEAINDDAGLCEFVSSPNLAVIAAIDRVLAIPHGVSFLRGNGIAHVPNAELDQLATDWDALLTQVGGVERAAKTLAVVFDRWGNGEEDARCAIDAVTRALGDAQLQGLDLLMLACPVP